MMEFNDPRLLAINTIMRLGFAAWDAYSRGELTGDNLDRSLDEIRKQAAAEDGWHASKQTSAAKARPNETKEEED